MEDLLPGMELNGVVTNITNFGAFVDVGVHQDGLVHISAMSDTYIKNPADFLKGRAESQSQGHGNRYCAQAYNLTMRRSMAKEIQKQSQLPKPCLAKNYTVGNFYKKGH